MSLSASLIYHSASQKGRVWRGPVESNHRALVGSWDDQSGEGLLMHTVALIAWTVLICFRGEGGSRYSGKTPKAPKNGLNCAQNQSNFRPRGAKVEVRRAPGQVWGRLAPSWASWGGFGSFLERLGRVVEESWAVLGPKRWPTWYQVGRQNGSRIDQKWIQKSICFMKALGDIIFQYILAFWSQNPYHVGSKIN